MTGWNLQKILNSSFFQGYWLCDYFNESMNLLDPETEELLIPFREAVDEAGSFPVGQTTVTIEYEDCRNAECNMGR